MINHEIVDSLEKIIANLNKDDFIYEFLIAYGISKSIVTRLRRGDQNRSKREGEVLYAKYITPANNSGGMSYCLACFPISYL